MFRAFEKLRQAVKADQVHSPEVRKALVAALFASPLSLLIGAIVGTLTAIVAAQATADIWVEAVAYAIPAIGVLRVMHCLHAKGLRRGEPSSHAEFLYELGAWAYAAAIGALAFLSLSRTSDPQVHLLTSCMAIGYAAGICARNAARPLIAVGQLALSSLPVAVVFLMLGGTTQLVLSFSILLFIAGMSSVTAQTYLAVSRALSSARLSAAKARDTLDSIPQMVWSHGTNGTDEYYNQQWDDFTGHALRSGDIKRIDLVHPEDRERVATAWMDCWESGIDYEAEYRIRHKSGSYRWVFSRGRAARDNNGNIVRWYGSCTDIHERVLALQALNESEALNRGIIEASPDSVSLLDVSGKVMFANRAAHEAYGLANASLLLGDPWAARFDPSARADRDAALEEARQGGVGRVSISLPTRTGAQRWFDCLLAPVLDAGGRATRIVVTSRDVTHQRRIEEEVRWSAAHDYLTGLPNRASFQAQLRIEPRRLHRPLHLHCSCWTLIISSRSTTLKVTMRGTRCCAS